MLQTRLHANAHASAAVFLSAMCCTGGISRAQAQAPTAASLQPSPWGIGADYHTGQDLTRWIPQMAAIGINYIRTCTPGQMDYLRGYDIDFGGLLYAVPPDDTLDVPGTLPVKDLASWSSYVTKQVLATQGRAKDFEVWNEPPNGIGADQTPADYAKIIIAAYNAAHTADPTAKIGLATKSVDINWLEQVIDSGAKDHFDFITLHPYEVLGGVGDGIGTESVYMHIVPTLRKMLAAHDPAKVNVPVILTEIGYDAGKSPQRQAEALVKAYTMGIAEGMQRICWFEGIDGDSGPMGLLDGSGTPRPAYTAMAQMIQQLGKHPVYVGWLLIDGRDYAFVFRGGAGYVAIAWTSDEGTDNIRFGRPLAVDDPLTGVSSRSENWYLTDSPVIIDGAPALWVSQARTNRLRPFPWDGDYTKANSVSITFGAANTERGLHTEASARVAADVVDYGGLARSGSIPGGNLFIVDPNFLSYTPTKIQITAVVRRDAANDNAGFKLVYESTNGFKSTGWYTVPDNQKWYTVSWTVDDDEFVNYWGYNFSLVSDGNVYNKYDIQSVTVTKVE